MSITYHHLYIIYHHFHPISIRFQVKASSLAVVGSVQRRVTTTYETCHSKAQQAVTSAKAKTVEISTKAKNVAKARRRRRWVQRKAVE